MALYRKKSYLVNAVQYTEYGKLVTGMCNSQSCFTSGNNEPHVHTIHNNQIVNLEIGDWIIPEPDGIHYYPVADDIFKDTYEIVIMNNNISSYTSEFSDKRGREWEVFFDEGYFGCFCVRLKGDTCFNSYNNFHFATYEMMEKFIDLLKNSL